MNKSDILKAAKWRSAIKQFDPDKKISDEDWQFLLGVARLSPSSFGLEPWNIIVLQNPELRRKIKPIAWGAANPDQLDTASHFVVFTSKDITPDSEYFAHIKRDIHHLPEENFQISQQFFKTFQASDFDLTDARQRQDWAAKQAYIAMANMMLAAAEIGIDSCPIEGFDQQGVNKILSDAGVLDLKTDRVAVMCAFGYRVAEPAYAKTRRPMDEIVKII
ncbi:NAD(P)H-dependent oxidoreductase [Candidatus Saccharibacteria bacterium]|nr:NAD(P)H-dependent oxidoreductase [Candidatus Saccharibacteria bacterium]